MQRREGPGGGATLCCLRGGFSPKCLVGSMGGRTGCSTHWACANLRFPRMCHYKGGHLPAGHQVSPRGKLLEGRGASGGGVFRPRWPWPPCCKSLLPVSGRCPSLSPPWGFQILTFSCSLSLHLLTFYLVDDCASCSFKNDAQVITAA